MSLVEVLVAMLLGGFVVHLGLETLQMLDRHARAAALRWDLRVSVRVARRVLRAEFALADPTRDWEVGSDTIALRAFRGTGLVCPASLEGASVRVAYRGWRMPDPTKDSLEVTTAEGTSLIVGLRSVSRSVASCSVQRAPEDVQVWVSTTALPPTSVVLRPFERGSYHLSGAAFRYRTGGGGRQPLTPETLDDRASGFSATDAAVRATLTPLTAGRGWAGVVGWRDPP